MTVVPPSRCPGR